VIVFYKRVHATATANLTPFMLPAAKHTAEEEEAFMEKLLTDPPVTPTCHRAFLSHKPGPGPPHSTRSCGINVAPIGQLYSAGQVDLEAEISGWDWDALSDYVPSPKKSRDSPRKTIRAEAVSTSSTVSNYVPEPCTRCIVQTVTDTWNDGVREKVRIIVLCALNFMNVIDQRILAKTELGLEPRSIVLRDDWVYTDVHEGRIEIVFCLLSLTFEQVTW
jgi:hypothetical protein